MIHSLRLISRLAPKTCCLAKLRRILHEDNIFMCSFRVILSRKKRKSPVWNHINQQKTSTRKYLKYSFFYTVYIINKFSGDNIECVFYRYEEFHPFLFSQHSKGPYLEFDSFNKVRCFC